MKALKIHDLLPKRALVTRESADSIRSALAGMKAGPEQDLTIDFSGVEAITPAFIDELLWILKEALKKDIAHQSQIVFVNLPTRLSSKFAVLARAHEMEVRETEIGVWVMSSRVLTRSEP